MKLSQIIFAKDGDAAEIMLSTVAPFYAARAYKFESPKAMEEFAIKHNAILDAEHVPGYNILICLVGTIEDIKEKIVFGHNVPADAKPFLKEAVKFYEQERIKGNKTRNKKFARR